MTNPICPDCGRPMEYTGKQVMDQDVYWCEECSAREDAEYSGDDEYDDDPDDIEMNRQAYEALYPDERDRDCPICGRWRSTQFVSSEGVRYLCASCDDQIYTADETGEFEDE